MPPDGIVQVGTQVNVAPIRSGFAEAEAAVKQASANMAEAQLQFGKAAEQGNQQAAAALAVYRGELRSAEGALESFNAVQQRVASGTRTMTSTFYAAQGASAALAGRIPYRAMERFLADIPGVNAALMTAFPVIGALAIGEVLVRSTEKLVQFTTDAEILGRETGTNWLTGAIGQLDGLQQAADQADQAISQMAQDMDHSQSKIERNQIEHIRLTQGNAAAYRAEADAAEKKLEALQKGLQIEQQNRPELEAQSQERYHRIDAKTGLEYTGGYTSDALKAQQDLRTHDASIADYKKKISDAQGEIDNLLLQAKQAAAKEAAKNSPGVELPIHAPQVRLGGEHPIENAHKEAAKALERAAREDQRTLAMMQELQAKMQGKEFSDFTEKLRSEADEKIKSASTQYRGIEQNTQLEVHSGSIKPEQRIAILQAAAAQEYATQAAAIKAKEALDAGAVKKYQDDLNQQQLITQAYYEKQAILAEQAANLKWEKFHKAFSQIDSDFNSSVDSWLRGTQRASFAFTKMADDMAIQFTNSLMRQAEAWVENQIKKQVIHEVTTAAISAQDQAAAALSQATSAQSTLKQITHYAALAAAKAYSALADIPIVGPALGAVAAGATFAAVEALAAFDQGTSFIPRDGVGMLHKGEAVLPPPQTEALMEALGRGPKGSSRSVDNSIGNLTFNYHGGRSSGPEDMHAKALKFLRARNAIQ